METLSGLERRAFYLSLRELVFYVHGQVSAVVDSIPGDSGGAEMLEVEQIEGALSGVANWLANAADHASSLKDLEVALARSIEARCKEEGSPVPECAQLVIAAAAAGRIQ